MHMCSCTQIPNAGAFVFVNDHLDSTIFAFIFVTFYFFFVSLSPHLSSAVRRQLWLPRVKSHVATPVR